MSRPRRVAALCGLIVSVLTVAPVATGPAASADTAVTVDGVGAAHGMGLAMDGVLGQSKAGWTHSRTLAHFYPGTKASKASGIVRVGLATAAEHAITLPAGGEVSDAPRGGDSGRGFPVRVEPGGTVYVMHKDGAYRVRGNGIVAAAQSDIVPTLPPAPSDSPPDPFTTPPPEPTPSPTAEPPPPSGGEPGRGLSSQRPIWISPKGDPAVAAVGATGRRYRGRMQIQLAGNGALWAVNHVDLETYVRGIAEEKGAGWPVEGLKVLAVAARTLAAATMQWYSKNHANGFDICATSACQVYLGMDGEEASMTKATQATAGDILTHGGRPILAMYHGNGGGRTESYKLLYGNGVTDPHPYLQSVTYAHAAPSTWQKVFSAQAVTAALRARGIAVPGRVTRVEILERGLSPRVRKLRIESEEGSVETTGLRFQDALGLRSAWFSVTVGGPAPDAPDPIVPGLYTDALANPDSVSMADPLPEVEVTVAAAARDDDGGRDGRLPLVALAALLVSAASMGATRTALVSPTTGVGSGGDRRAAVHVPSPAAPSRGDSGVPGVERRG